MLLGILVATTGFTLLTGSATRSELAVTGQVNSHYRGAYDILVRPSGSRSTIEKDAGLLRPNFLSSQYGGITSAQLDQMSAVRGVEVAAPIGMLGYAPFYGANRFDLTPSVDPAATNQLLRVSQVWRADRGLTMATDLPSLVYVTKRPVAWPASDRPDTAGQDEPIMRYTDGRTRGNPCGARSPWPVWELGQKDSRPLCLATPDRTGQLRSALVAHLDARGRYHFQDRFGDGGIEVSDRLNPLSLVMLSLPVAAIDPEAEARLVGLDGAISEGRYLSDDPTGRRRHGITPPITLLPAIATSDVTTDEETFLKAERVPVGLLTGSGAALAAEIAAAPATASYETEAVISAQLQQSAKLGGINYFADGLLKKVGRPGPVEYDLGPGESLNPRLAPPASERWNDPLRPSPMLWSDHAMRSMGEIEGTSASPKTGGIGFDIQGYFDKNKLRRFDPLARTPLDTYDVDLVTGADAATRERLGGEPLAPNSNPGGYTNPPPSILISLNWLTALTGEAAPISAVRVRVAGLSGFDAVSREMVRRVADDIAKATGLDVEVTLGASPSARTIDLPAGRYGRPDLRISEMWTQKGVAATIVKAMDRKSAALFAMVLVVCTLFLGNAVAAAARDRRAELAILGCLGWQRWRLAALLISEAVVVAVAAGILSAGVAVPLGRVSGLSVPWKHALWAPAVAVAVAILASTLPAWRVAASPPLIALQNGVSGAGSGRLRTRPRGLPGMAVTNLRRMPGRTALGTVALAIGVANLTILAAVTWAFHGTVTGSLLGDAVSLEVRRVDLLAVIATVFLGLIAVADVLYLGVRERAAELALLRAAGWSVGACIRLIVYEGLGLGLLGGLAGSLLGLGAAAAFAGALPMQMLYQAAATAAGAMCLAGATALVPALLYARRPMSARLLAD
ncbi:FtsX-like permease family protein [Micromonospora musae]|uniref:FtsX-like permease family protein n=1 Tax=Micromonospora musae TaxID=1894970 RepID=UPI003413C995